MKRKILAIILSALMLIGNVTAFAETTDAAIADEVSVPVTVDEATLTEDVAQAVAEEIELAADTTDTVPANTIPASAEIDNWSSGGANVPNIDKTENYYRVTNSYAYSGNNSLEVLYKLGDIGNTYLSLNNFSVQGIPAGFFDLSFKIKGTKNPAIKIIIEQSTATRGDDFAYELKYNPITRMFDVEDLGDGWFGYTSKNPIQVKGTGTLKKFYFQQFDTVASPIYIDDIVLSTTGSTENILSNGGFEDITIINEDAKYEPSNVNACTFYNKVTATWKNPAEPCEEIRLYDVTDGKNVLLSNIFTTTAGAYNHYKTEEAATGTYKQFRLEFDFGNGHIVDRYFYRQAADRTAPSPVGGWAVERSNNLLTTFEYSPIYVAVDANNAHSGISSLYVESTIGNEQDMKLELNINFNDVFKEGELYEVSVWAKGQIGATASIVMEFSSIGNLTITDKNWKRYSFVYDPTKKHTSGCLKFWFNKPFEQLWIDSLEVHRIVNGEPGGENLVADADLAGFEKLASTAVPSDISGLNVVPVSRGAEFTWDSTSKNTDTINIYEEVNGDLFLRAEVAPSLKKFSLKNLTNDEEHKFVVKAVTSSLIESAGQEIIVIPVAPDVEVDEVYINNGTDALVRGVNTFTTTAYNNYQTELFNAQLIVALFKNDGKELVSLNVAEATLLTATSSVLSAEVNIPNDGEKYSVQAYIWDDLYNLESLKTVKTLNIE